MNKNYLKSILSLTRNIGINYKQSIKNIINTNNKEFQTLFKSERNLIKTNLYDSKLVNQFNNYNNRSLNSNKMM